MPTSEFTQQQIDEKLAEIGLRRGLISVDEACAALNCSRSYYYAALAGRPGQGRELRHVTISEKIVGCYSIDVAALLLRRERNPIQVRTRGKRRERKAKTG